MENLDKILLSNNNTLSPTMEQVSAHFGSRQPSEHNFIRPIIKEVSEKEETTSNNRNSYLPMDIKHLEHII